MEEKQATASGGASNNAGYKCICSSAQHMKNFPQKGQKNEIVDAV
jgi:hypothetical protein